jgi:hypothetical protein
MPFGQQSRTVGLLQTIIALKKAKIEEALF